jgi:hypothetical protein
MSMSENELRRKLALVKDTLNTALVAAKTERTNAEQHFLDAGEDAQRKLDGRAVPADFDVEGYASASVAVFHRYAEYLAAEAKLSVIHRLIADLA